MKKEEKNIMDLKEMIDKAHKYDNSLEFFEEREKHTKGYIYDSLCYRYQLARYKAMKEDIEMYINSKGYTKKEAENAARKLYERDCKRFYQILNEAIGEHD